MYLNFIWKNSNEWKKNNCDVIEILFKQIMIGGIT